MADDTGAEQERRDRGSEKRERFLTPAVDIYEARNGIVLLAEMPGVGESGLEVTVEDEKLTILGRPSHTLPEGASEVSCEFAPRAFRRTFALSRDVDTSRIKGRIRNGVLTLEVPRAEESRVRKVEIKTE